MYDAINDNGAGACRAQSAHLRGACRALAALALLLALGLSACSGKTEEEYLSEANAMMQEQNLLKATILYKEFLEKFPESPDRISAQMGLAEAYYRSKDYELCRGMLDEIIAHSGGPASDAGFRAFLTKLRTFDEENRFQEGLALAEQTSNTLSAAPLPMKQAFQKFLGDLYARNQRPQEAVDTYALILGAQPANVDEELFHLDLLNRAASLYEFQGRLDAVPAMLDEYLASHPGAGIAGHVRQMAGRAAKQLGDSDRAEAYFDGAEAAFRQLLDQSQQEESKIRYMIALANLDYMRDRTEKADTELRHIIDTYPNSSNRAVAMNLLAASQARAGDYETALSMLQQVVSNYPNTREAAQAVQQAQAIVAARQGDAGTTSSAPTAVSEAMPLAGDEESTETESAPAAGQP